MKVGDVQLLKREDLPDAKGEWVDKLLLALNTNSQSLSQVLSGRATLTENTNSAFVTQKITHGVPLRIKNPLGVGKPAGVLAVSSDGLAVAGSVAWRRINSEAQPDQLELTVNFARGGGETMTLALLANQSIPNATETGIVFGGIATAGGETATNANGSISWNGSTGFTLNKPGQYLVNATISWAVSGAGTRGVYLVQSVAGTRYAATEGPPQGTFFTQQQVSAVLPVSTTLHVIVSGNHQAGAELNAKAAGALTDMAGFSNRCWAQATRLLDRSVTNYSANVTFLILGG